MKCTGQDMKKIKKLACPLQVPLSPNLHVFTSLETLTPVLLGLYRGLTSLI